MMRRTVLAVASLGLVWGLAACGGGSDTGSSTPTSGTSGGAASSASASATTDGHTGADVMFAQMMIPHHAQAVEMSTMLLHAKGVDRKVRKLAEDIKAAQQPEIEQMSGWSRNWGQPVPTASGSAEGMAGHGGHDSGMMSQEDMAALGDASGPKAGRLFLEQMIRHHQGAIAMAQQEVEQGSYPDAVSLARKIVSSQQAEVATMRALLGS